MNDAYIQTKGGFYRCDECKAVKGPLNAPPPGCIHCHFNRRTGATFTQIEVAFPNAPSAEAIEQDTREIEVAIRDAYYAAANAHPSGYVPLATIRALLSNVDGREAVDAALTKLASHSDVYYYPAGHLATTRTNQEAALAIGGTWDHFIMIDPHGRDLGVAFQALHMSSRTRALSILAPLGPDQINHLATKMGVADAIGEDLDVIRERIADQAETNRQEWLSDARQGAADGTLLYRADKEPDWVASWSPAEKVAASEAAARLLVRADREQCWAFVRDRAMRWLFPERELLWVDGGPGADFTTAATRRRTDVGDGDAAAGDRYAVYTKRHINRTGAGTWMLRSSGPSTTVAEEWPSYQHEPRPVAAHMSAWLDYQVAALLGDAGMLRARRNDSPRVTATGD